MELKKINKNKSKQLSRGRDTGDGHGINPVGGQERES